MYYCLLLLYLCWICTIFTTSLLGHCVFAITDLLWLIFHVITTSFCMIYFTSFLGHYSISYFNSYLFSYHIISPDSDLYDWSFWLLLFHSNSVSTMLNTPVISSFMWLVFQVDLHIHIFLSLSFDTLSFDLGLFLHIHILLSLSFDLGLIYTHT